MSVIVGNEFESIFSSDYSRLKPILQCWVCAGGNYYFKLLKWIPKKKKINKNG
jgi:hypothetical protein